MPTSTTASSTPIAGPSASGQAMTTARLLAEVFSGGWVRVAVTDAADKRAWSNPLRIAARYGWMAATRSGKRLQRRRFGAAESADTAIHGRARAKPSANAAKAVDDFVQNFGRVSLPPVLCREYLDLA